MQKTSSDARKQFRKKTRLNSMVTIVFPDNTRRKIDGRRATAEELLARLGLNPYEFIIAREGRMITEDTPVADDDELQLTAIVHGG